MRYIIFYTFLFIVSCKSTHNDFILSENPYLLKIRKINHSKNYSKIHFTFQNSYTNPVINFKKSNNSISIISIRKETVLKESGNNNTYNLIKTRGIANQTMLTIIKSNQKANFVLFFEKMPKTIKKFDLIECESLVKTNCWNFKDIPYQLSKK